MTGIYFRVERDGKFNNIEFEFLTPDERAKILEKSESSEIKKYIDILCNTILSEHDYYTEMLTRIEK